MSAGDGGMTTAEVHRVLDALAGAGCFVPGRIGGRSVLCASSELQLRAHAGYEPRPVDRHDLAVLRGLAGPDS